MMGLDPASLTSRVKATCCATGYGKHAPSSDHCLPFYPHGVENKWNAVGRIPATDRTTDILLRRSAVVDIASPQLSNYLTYFVESRVKRQGAPHRGPVNVRNVTQ